MDVDKWFVLLGILIDSPELQHPELLGKLQLLSRDAYRMLIDNEYIWKQCFTRYMAQVVPHASLERLVLVGAYRALALGLHSFLTRATEHPSPHEQTYWEAANANPSLFWWTAQAAMRCEPLFLSRWHPFELDSVEESRTNEQQGQQRRALHNLRSSLQFERNDSPNARWLIISDAALCSLPDSIGGFWRLEGLVLPNNRLTMLPPLIGKLTLLRRLDLRHNRLTRLPESIGFLTELEQLFLQDNELVELPDAIGSLKSLNRLYAHRNRLETVPSTIGNLPNLQQLNLAKNRLRSLPGTLVLLESLSQLTLSHNQLDAVPDCVGKLPFLQQLNMLHNPIRALPDNWDSVTSRLDQVKIDKRLLIDDDRSDH
ncbi:uncharacterized protein BJ171DRAFT_212551 [Polychytrium aggregatum]|uniref:uncharacterized protein n=1 Tax=Polychytrium aggregatum TaxID=110093 RepID=UPI0022FDF5FD|nr:uncharacterized protein BJ171DRAFT_212551 [Polychytrium aggregatum]KAI9208717.1 hypothetical protein BJ171DRAFT_212551 [Polychytrium aggregatum]